jgi:hypothetical protein
MPQKQSKAHQSRDNWQKKSADNGSDKEAELAPPVGKHAQRSAKKADTKGWAPPAMETGYMAAGMEAKSKEIKQIDSEELDDEGAQSQVGAKHNGKTAKSPKTKMRALTPMKKDRQMVGAGAKADNGMGGNWDDSDAKSPGDGQTMRVWWGMTPPLPPSIGAWRSSSRGCTRSGRRHQSSRWR